MILGLTGEEPDTVSAVGTNHLRGDISDITTTHMTFPSGIHASIFVSWLHPYKEQKLIVIGSTATAVLDDTKPWGSKLMVYEATGAVYPVEMAPAEPLREECEHFMACITNNLAPITNGNEGLRVLKVLKLAQESMDDKGQFTRKVIPEYKIWNKGGKGMDGLFKQIAVIADAQNKSIMAGMELGRDESARRIKGLETTNARLVESLELMLFTFDRGFEKGTFERICCDDAIGVIGKAKG